MRHAPRLHALVALLALAPALQSGPARAVDGVIEINNARAVAGGVTSGDTPGYPVTIDQSGSYRLTGPIYVSGWNLHVVEITADHVTLDLGGFEIRCLWFVTPCAGNGTGTGIYAPQAHDVTIRNGVVREVASTGIHVGRGARIEDVRVLDNGGSGIWYTFDAYIANSVIRGNGGNGILVEGTGGVILGNNIANNMGYGIDNYEDTEPHFFAYGHNSFRLNFQGAVEETTGITPPLQTAGNLCNGSPCP